MCQATEFRVTLPEDAMNYSVTFTLIKNPAQFISVAITTYFWVDARPGYVICRPANSSHCDIFALKTTNTLLVDRLSFKRKYVSETINLS